MYGEAQPEGVPGSQARSWGLVRQRRIRQVQHKRDPTCAPASPPPYPTPPLYLYPLYKGLYKGSVSPSLLHRT